MRRVDDVGGLNRAQSLVVVFFWGVFFVSLALAVASLEKIKPPPQNCRSR